MVSTSNNYPTIPNSCSNLESLSILITVEPTTFLTNESIIKKNLVEFHTAIITPTIIGEFPFLN